MTVETRSVAVPLPVTTAAPYARFASRQGDSPSTKMVAALRERFGGHVIQAAKERRFPCVEVIPPAT